MSPYGTNESLVSFLGICWVVHVQVKPNPFFCESSDKAHVLVFILETTDLAIWVLTWLEKIKESVQCLT